MPIDAARLLAHQFPELQQSYDRRDAILYALGLGLGQDPTDEEDLRYLLETRLDVLPSFAVTLASPGMWIRDPAFGVDFTRLVHAEQDVTYHRPLPETGSVVATPRVAGLWDRGAGRGAVLAVERIVRDEQSGEPYATVHQTLLLRGDGGFGGETPPPPAVAPPPERAPDHLLSVSTSPRAALIYRLSGDWNPLHADPAFAARAGFDKPILHGLATYGIAVRAMGRMLSEAPARLGCRFSGVVTPGDRVDFKVWEIGAHVSTFEAMVGDRKVLDRGIARLGS